MKIQRFGLEHIGLLKKHCIFSTSSVEFSLQQSNNITNVLVCVRTKTCQFIT